MTTEKDKGIALVTGGATGIGSACCRELAASGFRVGIHYRSSDLSARKLQEELPGSFLVKGDLSTEEGVEDVFQVIKKEGGLEVLVNNAGMTLDAPLVRAKLDHFDQIVSLNMRGTWYLTKRLSRLMIRQSRGRIINISSVVGSTGNIGQTIYGMTKAAIENFTKTCAQELAHYKILVNAVAPGFIETQMTEAIPQEQKQELLKRVPLGEMGRPEDVATMVRFLATEGNYCTGNVFHVNGGMYGG
jgi:3-oxoacyl-[acyl-carrier protein] reductase